MGKQSTRDNKNIYQICREERGLTREKASEGMTGVSASRIEKIEYELQEPTPYDIVQMADCYHRPDLCNYYCSHRCNIGDRYVPEIEDEAEEELPQHTVQIIPEEEEETAAVSTAKSVFPLAVGPAITSTFFTAGTPLSALSHPR